MKPVIEPVPNFPKTVYKPISAGRVLAVEVKAANYIGQRGLEVIFKGGDPPLYECLGRARKLYSDWVDSNYGERYYFKEEDAQRASQRALSQEAHEVENIRILDAYRTAKRARATLVWDFSKGGNV